MFPGVMLFQDGRLHRALLTKHNRPECHLCDLFQNDSMFNGILYRFSPAKRTMLCHQNPGNLIRIPICKPFDNHLAGCQFILTPDLLPGQHPGARNLPVKMIGMGGSQAGNRPARLSP